MSLDRKLAGVNLPPVTEAPSLRERQKQRRRHRIYTVAVGLFRERGFHGTTATDIAKAAHVSRGTFFNYYPYKEAVLLDYGTEVLTGLRERAEARLAEGTRPLEVLDEVWTDLASITVREKDLIPPLVYELVNPDPERSRKAYEALPLSSIHERLLEGATGLRADLSRERIAATLSDAYLMTALRWTAYQRDLDLRDELGKVLALVLHGAFTR